MARTVAIGGIVALGLGSAQAAKASPSYDYHLPCSADALEYAMSHVSSGDTLLLDAGCTYYLDDGLTDSVPGLTIAGFDSTLEGGSYGSDFSILYVDCMDSITLDDVNFTDGSQEYGGAIDNDGSVTINGGTFSKNSGEYGGAIYSYGYSSSLTISGATFTGNTAEYGGAIYNDDSGVTISDTTFSRNSTRGDDAGGAIYNYDNDMTVSDSSFLGNTSTYGGAIYNDDDLTLEKVNGVPASGDTFTGNQAYQGGAIYNDDDLTADDSVIVFNAASGEGGGIYNHSCSSLTLSDSYVYANVVDNIYYEDDC